MTLCDSAIPASVTFFGLAEESLAKPEDNGPHASDDKSIRGVRPLRYQSASDEKIYTTERPKARFLQ